MVKIFSMNGWNYCESTRLNPIQMGDFSGLEVFLSEKGLKLGSGMFVPFGDFLAKNTKTGELKIVSRDEVNAESKLMPAETGDIREGIFKDIVGKLYETYKKKNADYGNSFAKIFAKRGMNYALGHIEEKLERVDSLQSKPNQVSGESFVDSLEDMANYAILTLIELRLQEKEPKK